MSRRHCYYSDRMMAKVDPENYLCIIHNKMDHAKTWLLRIGGNQPKSLSVIGHQMPFALTRMLTHGRDLMCTSVSQVYGQETWSLQLPLLPNVYEIWRNTKMTKVEIFLSTNLTTQTQFSALP